MALGPTLPTGPLSSRQGTICSTTVWIRSARQQTKLLVSYLALPAKLIKFEF
jgi:hypothetical protein